MPYDTVVAKTIEYLAIPSVVGHEQFFLKYLQQDFEKLGLKASFEHGILAVSGAKPHSCVISAHADRHGLISLGNGKYQYAARNIKENKYDKKNSDAKSVLEAIGERFEGERVYAYNPETGDKLGEGTIEICYESMKEGRSFFNIPGMGIMPINTPIAYGRTAVSDGVELKGQIDNVVSLGIIYTLFQNGFQGTALLSTEEEIGKSWIHITNWLKAKEIETKELIIIDTSPYRETAPLEGHMVVLRNRDKSEVFNADLVEKIRQRATELLIPFQVKDEYFFSLGLKTKDLGSTELGRIVQNSDGFYSGATVQIPTMEYHTSYETTNRGCIESFYALLNNILILNPLTD